MYHEQIKNYYVLEGEFDKFTQTTSYEMSNPGIVLDVSNFDLISSVILKINYQHSNESDILIIKIHLNFANWHDKNDGLKNCTISFLLDGKEVIEIGEIIKFLNDDDKWWEETYLKADFALLSKLAFANKIEYRITNKKGNISEGEFSRSDLFKLKGFYNGLFDSEFMKDELLKQMDYENNLLQEKIKMQLDNERTYQEREKIQKLDEAWQSLRFLDKNELLELEQVAQILTDQEKIDFFKVYKLKRKDPQTGFFYCLIGALFGISGLNRFYYNNNGLGILYLLTWGFCGVGSIIDLFNNKKIALKANKIIMYKLINSKQVEALIQIKEAKIQKLIDSSRTSVNTASNKNNSNTKVFALKKILIFISMPIILGTLFCIIYFGTNLFQKSDMNEPTLEQAAHDKQFHSTDNQNNQNNALVDNGGAELIVVPKLMYLRSGPSTLHNKTGEIYRGEHISVLQTEYDDRGSPWHNINYKDGNYWICGSYTASEEMWQKPEIKRVIVDSAIFYNPPNKMNQMERSKNYVPYGEVLKTFGQELWDYIYCEYSQGNNKYITGWVKKSDVE
jgi:TM2 domain-containing membrane protein YozV